MADERNKIAHIVTGLDDPINTRLVTLLALDAPSGRREGWTAEPRARFRKISALRRKPHNAMPAREWLFDMLCREPFGGVEAQNVASLVALHAGETQPPNGRTAGDVADAVEAFHRAMTAHLAAGEAGDDRLAAP